LHSKWNGQQQVTELKKKQFDNSTVNPLLFFWKGK